MKTNFPSMRTLVLSLGLFFSVFTITNSTAQELSYPYPVKSIQLTIEQKKHRMVYMDIPSQTPNGRNVMLLHGKNFNGYYWKDVIPFLNAMGYRVIVPDQLGFGQSDKPYIHYSLHQMAADCKTLMDSLNIQVTSVIGHSMGGMLAMRFSLLYPSNVDRLVVENPVGLEDYRDFVPYKPLDSLLKKEQSANYESLKTYQQTYYPKWQPEYEQYVLAQLKWNISEAAWASALTYQMIYEQPVCHELGNLRVKTLFIIGSADRTIVGKDKISEEVAAQHGKYSVLGKQAQKQVKGSKLVELDGIGHIPHIQDIEQFRKAVTEFLE